MDRSEDQETAAGRVLALPVRAALEMGPPRVGANPDLAATLLAELAEHVAAAQDAAAAGDSAEVARWLHVSSVTALTALLAAPGAVTLAEKLQALLETAH